MKKSFDGYGIQKKLDEIKGPGKLEAIMKAIGQADEAEDHYYRLLFRYDYACEATFHDDPPKAMPVAVEFSKIFEEHLDVLGPVGKEMYVMMMELAVDPVVSLPQIPVAQWEAMMEQFHMLVKRYNVGHRAYWWEMAQFMIYVDKQKAFEYFQKFWKTGRDRLSDCRACERCYAIYMYLAMGDEENAAVHAMPIKARHIPFCGDTPHLMLWAYLEYYMDKGNLKAAIPYARELKRIGHRDRSDLSYVGAVLRCLAYSDPEQSVQLMTEAFPWIGGMWNQKMVYDFYKGAWTVLHQLSQKQDSIKLKLPEQLSCYQREGVYSTKEMEQWVYKQAEKIAERFDMRNGTDSFRTNLGLAVKEPRIAM
ncbi:MAG: hypothetical protein HFH82_15225 [Lachnospiraceae bacterium]|nr:hypothetical protein [Lachnospiraceae bacterium]